MEPLLAASAVRLDVAGVPAIDGLELATRCDHAAVLGGSRALFEAAAGLRGVSHGELRALGKSPIDAVRSGNLAGAPFDPPLPPRWSVQEYVTWSARLSGRDRHDAGALAAEAMRAFDLLPLAAARLGAAPAAARRGTVLAAALATGAGAIFLDDPLAGLADETAAAFARVIARALQDRRWVVFAARLPRESPLASSAEEVLILEQEQVVAQGAPEEISAARATLSLKVTGSPAEVSAFREAIASSRGTVAVTGHAREMTHLRVGLGPLGPSDLLRLAIETGATVLELRPFSLPLS